MSNKQYPVPNQNTPGSGGGGGGVTSLTGDGTIFSNSASTGAVTLTETSAGADTVLGNPTGSSAAPTYTSAPVVSSISAIGANGVSAGAVGTAGVVKLVGSTSGTATLTAPAVAGTSTNPVVSTNYIQGPAFLQTTNASGGFGNSTLSASLQWQNASTLYVNLNGIAGAFQLTNTGLSLANSGLNLGFTGGKGQHINTQAAASDIAGTVTVSSSTTASVVFTTNYTNTPAVVLTPQTTGLTSWFLSAVSNSGFTVTVAPSGTYTFAYHVIGNPN